MRALSKEITMALAKKFLSYIMSALRSGYKKIDSNIVIQEVGLDLDLNDSSTALLGSDDDETHPFGQLEESPHGRHLGIFSTMVLFISRIVGSGIFATSSAIYESCGRSPFMFCMAWLISYMVAFCGLYVYLELGSLIPRSGGTKVFLEVIYDKPYMLVTMIMLIYLVLFGFAILASLIFGEYILETFDLEPSHFKSRAVAIVFVILTSLFHSMSTKYGVLVQNVLGVLKCGLLVLLFLIGGWVLLFPNDLTGIESTLTWDRFFTSESDISAASFSNAIIMASFTLAGWNFGHASANEVKDPIRTFKIAGPASLFLVFLGYTAINFCYLSVLTSDELADSGSLVGSVLFEKLFGPHYGHKILTSSIALCTAGNVFVVVYSLSRVNQEVFREGLLPFSSSMASNQPFGTPLRCIALICALTVIILTFAPDGGIYGYIVSTEGYPVLIYTLFVALGLLLLRKRYPEAKAAIRATTFGTIFVMIVMLYVLLTPFLSGKSPNPKGTETWIPYPLVAVILIFVCTLYWWITFRVRPSLGEYQLVPETEILEDGLRVKKWIKVSTLLG